MGRKAGVTEEKLMALPDYEDSPDLTDLEKLVICYAVEMTHTPVEVPDELFAALRRRFGQYTPGTDRFSPPRVDARFQFGPVFCAYLYVRALKNSLKF